MTEEEVLKRSTGFYNINGLIGYFGFRDANYLVGTGKYKFEACGCWGYVLRKKER